VQAHSTVIRLRCGLCGSKHNFRWSNCKEPLHFFKIHNLISHLQSLQIIPSNTVPTVGLRRNPQLTIRSKRLYYTTLHNTTRHDTTRHTENSKRITGITITATWLFSEHLDWRWLFTVDVCGEGVCDEVQSARDCSRNKGSHIMRLVFNADGLLPGTFSLLWHYLRVETGMKHWVLLLELAEIKNKAATPLPPPLWVVKSPRSRFTGLNAIYRLFICGTHVIYNETIMQI